MLRTMLLAGLASFAAYLQPAAPASAAVIAPSAIEAGLNKGLETGAKQLIRKRRGRYRRHYSHRPRLRRYRKYRHYRRYRRRGPRIHLYLPLPNYGYYSYRRAGRCGYWHRRCVANWGYRNRNYYGCMRYYGCY